MLIGYMGGGKSYMLRKTKALLWPFIFFRVLLVAYWYLIESKFRDLDLGPIWFLLVLFLVETITFPLVSQLRKINWLITIGVLFSLSFLSLRNHLPSKWVQMWCNANIWFVIGMIIRLIEERNSKRTFSKKGSVILCFTLAVVSLFAPLLNGNVSVFSSVTNNFFLYIFFGIAGTMMAGVLCRKIIVKSRILEYFGVYSIIILAIHEPIKRILMKVLMIIGGKFGFILSKDSFSDDYILGGMLCLIVVLSCIPMINVFVYAKKHTGKFGKNILGFVK